MPVQIELALAPALIDFKRRRRWMLQGVDWKVWSSSLQPIRYKDSLETAYDDFILSLNSASEINLKKTKEKVNVKYSKPWWNKECAEVIKQKHRGINILSNCPTPINISNVKTPKGTPHKPQQGTPLSKKSSSVPASINNIENSDHHHQVIS